MIILEDTRNKYRKHINVHNHLISCGHTVQRSKLYVGDYCIANNNRIAIDTKQDVLELFSNLTKDHERFRNECIRSQEAGIQLIILIEEKLPQGGLSNWKSPVWKNTSGTHKKGDAKTKMNPVTARKIMLTMEKKYNVKFAFCSPEETGNKIIELLGV